MTKRTSRTIQILSILALLLVAFLTAGAAHGAPATVAPGAGRGFALLLNGDPTFTHAHNIEIATEALVALGYARSDIFVAGDRKELRAAAKELGARIGPDDLLLVYSTGHGARPGSESRLQLRDTQLAASDLAATVFALHFRRLIYIGDQCYSGGFASAMARPGFDVVAVSGSEDDRMARCEPFIRPFWRAAVGGASIEQAYREGSLGVKSALQGAPESITRYLSIGAAVGHDNAFTGGR